MKKKLFLHIGANKTGTSAIQNYCNQYRPELVRAGLLYPHVGCLGEAHHDMSLMFGFSHEQLQKSDRDNRQKQALDQLLEEVDYWSPNQIVFSSENFVLNGYIHEVASFFEDFDVSVVLYLRRHDTWWLSAYNQAVKQVQSPKWASGFLPFVECNEKEDPLYGNYRYLVDRWASIFGKERLIVRPYEAGQNKPNIVADFFYSIGRADLAPQNMPKVNESIDAWSLYFIDVVQRSDIEDALRNKIIQYILAHPHGGKAFSVRASILLEIIEKHRSDYEYIAREFLGKSDGKLYYEAPPSGDENIKNVKPTELEMISLVVKALA